MKFTLAVLVSVFSLSVATPLPQGQEVPPAGNTPPEGSVRINYVSSSGNGCPQYSVSQWISPDGTTVTMGFDDFSVFIGPTLPQSQQHENCQLHLALTYPGGYQYSIVQVYDEFSDPRSHLLTRLGDLSWFRSSRCWRDGRFLLHVLLLAVC